MLNRAVQARGLTLIELALGLLLLSLLMLVALPGYHEAMRKGRRTDAIARLSELQLLQERWRAARGRYADTLDELGLQATLLHSHYRLQVERADAAGYRASAAALEASPQGSDRRCATLVVALERGMVRYLARDIVGAESPDPRSCWGR
jgi:type IV pilus assembly protein PilE